MSYVCAFHLTIFYMKFLFYFLHVSEIPNTDKTLMTQLFVMSMISDKSRHNCMPLVFHVDPLNMWILCCYCVRFTYLIIYALLIRYWTVYDGCNQQHMYQKKKGLDIWVLHLMILCIRNYIYFYLHIKFRILRRSY